MSKRGADEPIFNPKSWDVNQPANTIPARRIIKKASSRLSSASGGNAKSFSGTSSTAFVNSTNNVAATTSNSFTFGAGGSNTFTFGANESNKQNTGTNSANGSQQSFKFTIPDNGLFGASFPASKTTTETSASAWPNNAFTSDSRGSGANGPASSSNPFGSLTAPPSNNIFTQAANETTAGGPTGAVATSTPFSLFGGKPSSSTNETTASGPTGAVTPSTTSGLFGTNSSSTNAMFSFTPKPDHKSQSAVGSAFGFSTSTPTSPAPVFGFTPPTPSTSHNPFSTTPQSVPRSSLFGDATSSPQGSNPFAPSVTRNAATPSGSTAAPSTFTPSTPVFGTASNLFSPKASTTPTDPSHTSALFATTASGSNNLFPGKDINQSLQSSENRPPSGGTGLFSSTAQNTSPSGDIRMDMANDNDLPAVTDAAPQPTATGFNAFAPKPSSTLGQNIFSMANQASAGNTSRDAASAGCATVSGFGSANGTSALTSGTSTLVAKVASGGTTSLTGAISSPGQDASTSQKKPTDSPLSLFSTNHPSPISPTTVTPFNAVSNDPPPVQDSTAAKSGNVDKPDTMTIVPRENQNENAVAADDAGVNPNLVAIMGAQLRFMEDMEKCRDKEVMCVLDRIVDFLQRIVEPILAECKQDPNKVKKYSKAFNPLVVACAAQHPDLACSYAKVLAPVAANISAQKPDVAKHLDGIIGPDVVILAALSAKMGIDASHLSGSLVPAKTINGSPSRNGSGAAGPSAVQSNGSVAPDSVNNFKATTEQSTESPLNKPGLSCNGSASSVSPPKGIQLFANSGALVPTTPVGSPAKPPVFSHSPIKAPSFESAKTMDVQNAPVESESGSGSGSVLNSRQASPDPRNPFGTIASSHDNNTPDEEGDTEEDDDAAQSSTTPQAPSTPSGGLFARITNDGRAPPNANPFAQIAAGPGSTAFNIAPPVSTSSNIGSGATTHGLPPNTLDNEDHAADTDDGEVCSVHDRARELTESEKLIYEERFKERVTSVVPTAKGARPLKREGIVRVLEGKNGNGTTGLFSIDFRPSVATQGAINVNLRQKVLPDPEVKLGVRVFDPVESQRCGSMVFHHLSFPNAKARDGFLKKCEKYAPRSADPNGSSQ